MRATFLFSSAMLSGLLTVTACTVTMAADPSRKADVAARGAQVMPFDLKATAHMFAKTMDGGVQQVIARNPADTAQTRLIREHLKEITRQFRRGNFSAPTEIHGPAMPGLAELRDAKPGEIEIRYQDLPNGGQIRYSTLSAPLVAALHQWFDAQLSDHGADAMEGQEHHGMAH